LVDVFRPGRVFVDGDSKVFPTINYIKNVVRAMCMTSGGTDVCQELWLQCIFQDDQQPTPL
jgi:hypothetical protein